MTAEQVLFAVFETFVQRSIRGAGGKRNGSFLLDFILEILL